ncbi:MAG: lipopolysaccharide kinase InaA family protein [Planctomycetota bacterium]
MNPVPILERLPEDYSVERGDRGVLAMRRDCAPSLRAAGYGLDSDGGTRTSRLSGRKPLLELPTPAGMFLIRRFSHGGLLRFLTGERFHDASRPFRELAAAASLARAGVNTPQVAAARARAAPGWGWKLEIVTRQVEDAIDLDGVLAAARERAIPRDALRRLARAAGKLVREMHDAGCFHADLTTKNLLVERAALSGGSSRMWILDLDRARAGEGLSLEERIANLTRLYRYVSRREGDLAAALARTDWMRFLSGYEPDRARIVTTARAILSAHGKSLRWHALGWRLENLFSGR